MHVVPVRLGTRAYDVHVGPGLLADAGGLIQATGLRGRCAVITDTNVAPLYSEVVLESLLDAGFEPHLATVQAGERSKDMAVAADLCERMIGFAMDRNSFVVALGGGVIGDLAGFAAAIFLRGVPYVQIPTTVLAQVDSSVGGKTGVNARQGKNLIGAFHQPRLVIADTNSLSTLPPREFNEGVAEIIKHAIIRDPQLLELLGEPELDLPTLIAENVRIKATIVAADEYETTGLRALLNFGHTIGHGIENAAGYGALLHGEAISLGIVAACRLSQKRAGLSAGEAERVVQALRRFGLPLQLPPDISTDAIMAALMKDKKFAAGSVRFVLCPKLGEAFVSTEIGLDEILDEIEGLR